MRLFALRGANHVTTNQREAILSATDELMRELMARNSLEPEAMVSCIFTLTDDLDAEFPAVAARNLGLNRVPLDVIDCPDRRLTRAAVQLVADTLADGDTEVSPDALVEVAERTPAPPREERPPRRDRDRGPRRR